jgi:SAM-dependent methyltransferase
MSRIEPTTLPTLPPFDKYYYYSESVQSPSEDVKFLDFVYKEARGAKAQPKTMREDFCGTFLNCIEWVKAGKGRDAYGIDLDPEPLDYGRANYLPKVKPELQKRVHLMQKNVLGKGLPKADIICALNFSYFIFKERAVLRDYFKNCLRTLEDKGVLVLDCFGGTKCYEANEEETEYDDQGYSYFWDQDTFDPITNEAMFYIHFKRAGEKKRQKVFTYDWRMWSIPELKDLLLEAGFKKVHTYWEGTTEDGEGDGEFFRADKGEDCDSWVSYLVALK